MKNTEQNTITVLLPYFDTSIQTKGNSASDASAVENDVSSSGLYQRTNHH